MKKLLVPLLMVVLLGLAGCGAADAPVESQSSVSVASEEQLPQPDLASTLEDIVGRWQGVKGGGGFVQIEGNGAWTIAYELDELDDPETVWGVSEVRFEENRLLITESVYDFGSSEICDNTGVYEVLLLAGGNIRFVAVEDECSRRVDTMQGQAGINVEYKPVS